MFKIIFIAVGLAVGFPAGVWMARHNPQMADQISAAEEKKFLEAQLAITQKIQAKLDQLSSKAASTKSPAGSGFLSANQAAAATPADVNELKSDTQKQQDELRRRLDSLK